MSEPENPTGPTGAIGHPGYCLPRTVSDIEHAITTENIPKIKELLKETNSIIDPDGDYPIHIASKYKNIDIIKLLLDNGANVNAVDYWKTTPLMFAGFYGHPEVIKFLIISGADYSMKNYWGEIAKDRAKENNHLDCVELLESYELSITKKAK